MLAQPGVPNLLGIRLQVVVREGVLCPGRSKERRALGIIFGEDPSPLEGPGLPHELHPLARFTQAGIVGLPRGFQASEQDAFLARRHSQRHFAHKGWRAFGRVGSRMSLVSHGCLKFWMRN
jgi:hypothetical protein